MDSIRSSAPIFKLERGSARELEESRDHMHIDERYQLLRQLGRGTVGSVYLARRLDTAERIALKIHHARALDGTGSPCASARETALVRRIDHPSVLRVHDWGLSCEGLGYLTMELLDGRSLVAHARQESLCWPAIRRLMLRICAAVEATHEAGVVHADLEPGNIFVLDADPSIKVLGFGRARLEHEPGTGAGQGPEALGTPGYMSPEQIRGESLDRRSDLYSLGVLLYELLCRRPPFTGASSEEVIARQLGARVPRLVVNPGLVGGRIEAIISRALSARREDRFASVAELEHALASL